MKKTFFASLVSFAIILFTLSLVKAQSNLKTASGPMAKWGISKNNKVIDGDTHDFGNIPAGTPVSVDFVVTNTGTAPLILSSVQASCGCTTPEWTKEPIPPGKSGKIKATYNAAAVGPFNKGITVISNSVDQPTKVLYIKGEVKMQGQ
ncbi:MAG: DUF1573 domain-containing protein [Microscillaceae bacterium]|nr:DUF1573 domain-containing protein [Microscillaceae bacterium]MDW8461576.1 DUF1573 domain-containing protein [Cytophagales bacterium]